MLDAALSFGEQFFLQAAPAALTNAQVNDAEQRFQRRMAEYSFNLEHQKLIREDFRDLVDLTVSRMDVYMVVSTLLLGVTMSILVGDGAVVKDKTGADAALNVVRTHFFQATLNAVGFLLLSLWLSIHASVASHSIGVRLLAGFARLTIPTRKELDELAQAPLMPVLERFLALGRRVLAGGAPEKETAQGKEGESEQNVRGGEGASAPAPGRSGLTSGRDSGAFQPTNLPVAAAGTALQEGFKMMQDRDSHFRRFVQEQQKWLSYDAYARVCMGLGINHLLTGFCYYLIGEVAPEVSAVCVACVVGLQCLSVLLLRLDVAEIEQTPNMTLVVLVCVFFPPIYVSVVTQPKVGLDQNWAAVFSTLACFLHAAWLIFIWSKLRASDGDRVQDLPKQLRTVAYLDVLDLDQFQTTEMAQLEETKESAGALEEAITALESRMLEIMDEEVNLGTISAARRAQLVEQELHLQETLREAEEGPFATATRPMRHEAAQALDRAAVWRRAPEILTSLQALRQHSVKGWLKESEHSVLESAYQDFLERCRELNLGIGRRKEVGSVYGHGQTVQGVSEVEVRVEVEDITGYFPKSVWVQPSTGKMEHEASTDKRTTNFESLINRSLPSFMREAQQFRQQRPSALTNFSVTPSSLQEDGLTSQASGRMRAIPLRTRRRRLQLPLVPSSANPPETLPGVIVRLYILLMAVLWIVSIVFLVSWVWSTPSAPPLPPLLRFQQVPVSWPKPTAFLKVSSIHCSPEAQDRLHLSSQFKLFASDRNSEGFPSFQEVLNRPVDAVLCRSDTVLGQGQCQALFQNQIVELPGHPEDLAALKEGKVLDLPADWRLLEMSWSTGTHAVLAAWDGREVVIAFAELQPNGSRVEPQYSVGPSDASCQVHNELQAPLQDLQSPWWAGACSSASQGASPISQAPYSGVKALRLVGRASQLFVLHSEGELLDGWDLEAGAFLGRWRLPSPAISFCVKAIEEMAQQVLAVFKEPELSIKAAELLEPSRRRDVTVRGGFTA